MKRAGLGLHLAVDAYALEQGVRVGILGIRGGKSRGGTHALIDAYGGRIDPRFGAEIVVAVDDDDKRLVHRGKFAICIKILYPRAGL